MYQQQELITLCKEPKELRHILSGLTKHRLVTIIREASAVRKEKYEPKAREPAYGSLPRGFNLEQIYKLFHAVRSRRVYKIMLVSLILALRIGEIRSLEILPNQDLVRLYNEKKRRYDVLPIPHGLLNIVREVIIMPKTACFEENLRKVYNETLERASLNYSFGVNKNGYRMKQYVYHSLRFTGITLFRRQVKDPILGMKYSRHRSKIYGEIGTYTVYTTDEMRDDMDKAFMPLAPLVAHALA